MSEEKKSFLKSADKITNRLAGIGAAIACLGSIFGAGAYLWNRAQSIGEVDLPATYENEEWRLAKKADYAWLADEWCYPTLIISEPRFASRAKHFSAGIMAATRRWIRAG